MSAPFIPGFPFQHCRPPFRPTGVFAEFILVVDDDRAETQTAVFFLCGNAYPCTVSDEVAQQLIASGVPFVDTNV